MTEGLAAPHALPIIDRSPHRASWTCSHNVDTSLTVYAQLHPGLSRNVPSSLLIELAKFVLLERLDREPLWTLHVNVSSAIQTIGAPCLRVSAPVDRRLSANIDAPTLIANSQARIVSKAGTRTWEPLLVSWNFIVSRIPGNRHRQSSGTRQGLNFFREARPSFSPTSLGLLG